MNTEFDVLLATYNGAPYLSTLIDSILCQLGQGKLIVHDDGSTDETSQIIQDYSRKDNRVVVLSAPSKGNAKDNFAYLMSKSEAKYIFFADQDDIWHPNKIVKMLKYIKFYESVFGENFPLLIHSDLRVIDESDNIIAKSFWKYQYLNPEWSCELSMIITQNVVTGCSVVINRRLKELVLPIPEEAIMHDWWMAIIANLFGKVVYINEAFIDYRQHSSNVVGAKKFDISYIFRKLMDVNSISISQFETVRQIEAILKIEEITEKDRYLLDKYYNLPKLNRFERIRDINKYNFKKIGFIRELVWLWLV